MKNKKILSVLLMLLMVLSLFGCSMTSETEEKESPAASAEDSEKSEEAVVASENSKKSGDASAVNNSKATTEANESSSETKRDSFSLKASPDKYTQYVDKYIGLNAASVGYTSLGGDRLIKVGAGYLEITFVTEDGSYVGPAEEDNLKNYVVCAQSIEPNTEVKLAFEVNSEGKEYDNLVDFQSYEKIDLLVKPVGADDPQVELTRINPSPDKYTYYIQNYVGKNLYSFGYESLGGEYRDSYGDGSLLINLSSEDGSYIDITDESVLKQYVVVDQNIAPNTELKMTYMTNSDGEEYSNLVDTQSYDSITLTVRSITGEPVISTKETASPEESENAESESSESDGSEADSSESGSSEAGSGYEAIYNDYAAQLEEKTQELIEEYKAESAGLELDAKAELVNKKVEVLAELSNTGVEEMAKYMLSHGDSEGYTTWSGKLYDVYMEQAQLIMDEYINNLF